MRQPAPISVHSSARVVDRQSHRVPIRLELEVLGLAAQNRPVADPGARANIDAALQHAVMTDLHVGAERHLGADDRERADLDARSEARLRVDDGGRVDAVRRGHQPFPTRCSATARSRDASPAARDGARRREDDGTCRAGASGRRRAAWPGASARPASPAAARPRARPRRRRPGRRARRRRRSSDGRRSRPARRRRRRGRAGTSRRYRPAPR